MGETIYTTKKDPVLGMRDQNNKSVKILEDGKREIIALGNNCVDLTNKNFPFSK